MALGQIEFTVVLAAASGFLIFTPEPLVLLRSFCVWAVCILVAWHGHDWWKRSPWVGDIATAFTTGHGLYDIAGLAWAGTIGAGTIGAFVGWANRSAGLVQRKSTAATPVAPGWTRRFSRWARGTRPVAASAPPGHPKYLVILVTTPPIHNYGPVSDHLYTTVDQPEPIIWSSTDTSTRSIPPMPASLAFRRHFALCLVPETTWKSDTTTVEEKLMGRLFWDHGGSTPSSRAAAWPHDRITKINAIHVLGAVDTEEDATERCTAIYTTLMANWGEYRNIWWNSADLALALAYLLVGATAASTCRAVMHRLHELRGTEVTEARREAWGRGSSASFTLFVSAFALTAMTGGAALPLTGPAMVGSFGAGCGSDIAASSLRSAELMRWKSRRQACDRLEKEFPRLQELFG